MPAKPSVHDLFKKSADGDEPCCARCGGKTFERKRVRIGYDVVIIYCTGCKAALGVVPAMSPDEMIESLRREIKKS
jgi:hypothetical protein